MQGPFKKRRHADRFIPVQMSLTVFRLILPYLFPGIYGDEHKLAFRTYLALTGTCQALRYWNFLRRWVAFASPPMMRDRLASHGFAVPLKPCEIKDTQEAFREDLDLRGELLDIPNPVFVSCWLKNAFFDASNKENVSNFEMDLGGNPFYDVIECQCDSTDPRGRDRTVICFRASSFAELCLFVYSTCLDSEKRGVDDSFLLMCGWKCPQRRTFHFLCNKSVSVMNRRVLGWLRQVGAFAPQELGFHSGGLPTTCYGLFLKLAETKGRKGAATPFERLETFVHSWFPVNLLGENPVEPAYRFNLMFE